MHHIKIMTSYTSCALCLFLIEFIVFNQLPQDPENIGIDGRVANYYILSENDVVIMNIPRDGQICSSITMQCSYPTRKSSEILRIVAKNAVGNSSGEMGTDGGGVCSASMTIVYFYVATTVLLCNFVL